MLFYLFISNWLRFDDDSFKSFGFSSKQELDREGLVFLPSSFYPCFGLLEVVNSNLGLKFPLILPKLHQHGHPTFQQDLFNGLQSC